MDTGAQVDRILRLYRRDVFCRQEALNLLMDLIQPENVCEVMERLSPEWHRLLREEAARAPTTEEGWLSLHYIGSYCGLERSESERQAWEQEQLQRHRRCIKSLRQHFADHGHNET